MSFCGFFLFYIDYGVAVRQLFLQGDLHALGGAITNIVIVVLLKETLIFDLDFDQLCIYAIRIMTK